MADYEFPEDPQIEGVYRTAYRALGDLVSIKHAMHVEDENLILSEVISHMRSVVDEAEMTVAARLGPLISWSGPRREGDWSLIAASADLDSGGRDFGDVKLASSAFEGSGGGWHGSAMDSAARAYKREAGWDFAPGEGGVWLLMLAPVSGSGSPDGDRPWFYSGHLVGFVVLHDRDDDDVYESVAHIWTASAWRRRRIARRLMDEARSRFSFTGVEGPYTEDGGAFLRATGILTKEIS